LTIPRHRFAIATRDELWILGARNTLLDARLSHGRADAEGNRIEAADERDGELFAACEEQSARLRDALPLIGEGRVRLVTNARRVNDDAHVEATIIISSGARSVGTTLEQLRDDLALLRATRDGEAELAYRMLPIVWRNGSGAVLLHEAIGHAAEHAHFGAPWPEWLRVRDEPRVEFDDAGVATRAADLLNEPPSALRRELFRDVPLQRMSSLVASISGAPPPSAVHRERIEIHLVEGGAYDPLEQTVAISVSAAEWIDGDRRIALAPFTIDESRHAIARALVAASGDTLRYPGVVCSREGQEVVVGSYAPVMVTAFA
jgi:hypothetical protein